MHITELDSFKLSDAVKFHNHLNPKIWGKDEHLLPEVRDKLVAIAANFQEFLGIKDLDVQDVTVSGSNAAYSYSPHSDIDLHLVVKFPSDDEVYQELFNAKKYQYNDEHNLAIGGVPVELYVQNAAEPPVSQGEYSVTQNQWIQVPRRKRARIDDTCVRAKVEDIDARIHNAIKSGDADVMGKLWQKIRDMRQSGLDQHGEFGCENIVFKILRNKGCIRDLRAARNAAQDREMSLQEQDRPHRFQWGFAEGHQGQPYSSEDGVAPSTCMFLNEDDDETLVQKFIQDTAQRLGIENMPKIEIHNDDDWSEQAHSFGMYVPDLHVLHVNMRNRHIMDILRTVAHELTHCRQHEIQQLGSDAGDTGSDIENEANAAAGIIMRDFADAHPELFDQKPVTESSGYIPTEAQADDPRFVMALTQDVRPGATGREANKLSLHTDSQGRPALLSPSARNLLREFTEFVAEEEILDEVAMSPTALRDWARSDAAQGIVAGFEAELIFRGLGSGEGESEPYYDEDRRADGISDIVDFFDDGDFNGRGDIRRLENQLREDYIEWLDEQSQEAWSEEQDSRITRWVRENYDPDQEAREAVAEENPDLDPDSDEFQEAVEERSKSMMAAQIDNALMDPANPYHEEAQDDWREDYYNEDRESEWLEDNGLESMSAIENNYNITWPYWTAGSIEGSRDADEIGKSLKQVVGMPVKVSDNYHTAKREPGVWIVETDGSLEPDDDEDGGREIVSPPMPLDQALQKLNDVMEWANDPYQGNAYTNQSTGLHMGVSIPEKGGDVDYTKLILFMGDKYVLQKFGREANTFCKSALDNMQSRVKSGQVDPTKVLQDMRNGLNDLASVAVKGATGASKYTSAHIKSGYIEFRSPGGDYLAEINVDMDALDSTMLRFARAMQIAGDPQAEREEYAKKLYKLVAPEGNDTLKYFAQYAAGTGKLPKDELKNFVKQAQQQRQGTKSQNIKWMVTMPADPAYRTYVTAPSEMEAILMVRNSNNDLRWADLEATPYQPGSTMDLAQQRAAAATQNATNPPWRDQLRNHMQTATQNVANPLWRDEPQGAFTGRWLIRDTSTGQTLYAFGGIGNSQADANRYAAQWAQANAPIGTDMTEVEVVPEMGTPVSEGRDLKEAASDYELHDREKLDQVLKKCCRMVIRGQQRNPEKYGQVAACVIDPENRQIFGINLPGPRGTRRHAERVAIDRYRRDIGEVPQGSIIVTTCSPCNSPMDERAGESCKDLLNSVGIHKVYAGYEDPTQHDDRDADFRT